MGESLLIKISIGWHYHEIMEQTQIESDFVFLSFCVIWANKLNHSELKFLHLKNGRNFRAGSLEARVGDFCSSDLWAEYSLEKGS